MPSNMGWKVVVGSILLAVVGLFSQLPWDNPETPEVEQMPAVLSYLSALFMTLGVLLGGIGLRHSQAKMETKLDKVMVIEAKVDKVLTKGGTK